jgi:signal transduction histidine kinase/CheY-like chemotaxis protein
VDVFSQWAEESRSSALGRVTGGAVSEANARFHELDGGGEAWRWLSGPHARVRYDSLSELVRSESATLAPAPYLARFERGARAFEVRLERTAGGAMALVHDVTGDMRRQRELQRDREALLHEERMHAMGVLASGVAHDLNHVLNIIALRVATLRADPALGKVRRTLDALGRVVGDAARIVARLQDLARKRRDRPSDALDLAAVLTGAIEMARTEAEITGVRIEAKVPPLPLVRGSAAELAHVFGSLLLHAREQARDGGTIRVRARLERGRVYVTIANDGLGLSEEDLGRLFDPFSGVARESALGLSVAWGVMTRLGGSIDAHSSPGQGTTFVLNFPLAAPQRIEPAKPAPQRAGSLRVLIVDDEQDNLDVLREILEMEGHEVTVARSGPEALGHLELGETFDLVLCDVGMPQMSGWTVAREIRRMAPATSVWMLTGWANEIGESDPRRELVRGILGKPLDLDQLRTLLSSEPRRPREESAPAAH